MSQAIISSQLRPSRGQAMALVLLSVMLWGAVPIINRFFLGTGHMNAPGAPYMALRYIIAACCFLPGLPAALRRWSWAELGRGALCGLAGVAVYNLLTGIGGHRVSAGLMGLINASEPLMILILVHLHERRAPGFRTMLSVCIGLAGIALLASAAGPAEGDGLGIALLVIAAAGWAVYCVLVPPLLKKHGALQVSAVTMVSGTLPLLAFGAPQLPGFVATLSPAEWEMIAFMGIGSSVVALLSWNKGSTVLGAEASGWFLYLIPVFAAGGGFFILGEPLTLLELAGGAMILGSVYIAQRR